MSNGGKVMVLIDSDNVSASVVEQALERIVADHGAAHVRRAYCTAESALKNLAMFKRLSVRPIVNVSTGKNSTDIALAVDAIDLVIAERPDIVVIVSSDSDFAPLVIRLREKGCRVEGIGQAGKTGDESVGVYDRFIDLEHHKPRAAAAKAARPARAPRAARAPKPAPAPPPPPAVPDDVLAILHAVPSLADGSKLELRIAAERLRAAGLLSASAPTARLFRKHAEHFALTPEKQPNKVAYIGPAR
jgi:uncharacterized protein (TIGR00288 family)